MDNIPVSVMLVVVIYDLRVNINNGSETKSRQVRRSTDLHYELSPSRHPYLSDEGVDRFFLFLSLLNLDQSGYRVDGLSIFWKGKEIGIYKLNHGALISSLLLKVEMN